jgi:antitoxin (DNA-binding transcriptional repressor) of toxin-antitoxin stability system
MRADAGETVIMNPATRIPAQIVPLKAFDGLLWSMKVDTVDRICNALSIALFRIAVGAAE